MRNLAKPLVLLIAVLMLGNGSYAQSRVPIAPVSSTHLPAPDARIDINHAGVNELAKVPGLTPVWAKRIVRFRPYRTKQDLLDRGVVSSEVYERIKDYVIAHRDKQ